MQILAYKKENSNNKFWLELRFIYNITLYKSKKKQFYFLQKWKFQFHKYHKKGNFNINHLIQLVLCLITVLLSIITALLPIITALLPIIIALLIITALLPIITALLPNYDITTFIF